MKALRLYAGPAALKHITRQGLSPGDIGLVPGAAGGPKGLILGPLDRFIFGEWLAASSQTVHLVGASIGAWRMASACLDNPGQAFERLEHDYIHQDYAAPTGRRRPLPREVSASFSRSLLDFYGGRVAEVLGHRRYKLHVFASRGRLLLAGGRQARAAAGYAMAYLSNLARRRALGHWLERVVFSSQEALPLDLGDYRTRLAQLDADNFHAAVRASCSIPFVLESVPDIPGAPKGAYWDGGLTDYHLHLNYAGLGRQLVLYPHFQKAVVPGWLDKGIKRRHRATQFLDNVLLLAPDPAWVKALPNGKLPDRTDFARYTHDMPGRVKAWSQAALASRQLADEFAQWVARPDPARVEPL
jgi:hypothetical protein